MHNTEKLSILAANETAVAYEPVHMSLLVFASALGSCTLARCAVFLPSSTFLTLVALPSFLLAPQDCAQLVGRDLGPSRLHLPRVRQEHVQPCFGCHRGQGLRDCVNVENTRRRFPPKNAHTLEKAAQ